MATHCNDIESLLPAYLDGELAPHDQLSFDHHVAVCLECRDHVRSEGAYLARVRELLAPPAAPDEFAARVREALDQEDGLARAARRKTWRAWALPSGAGIAAAAALLLLVMSETSPPRGPTAADPGDVQVAHRTGSEMTELRMPISIPFGGRSQDAPRVNWRPTQARFELQLGDGRHYQVGLDMLPCRNVDVSSHQKVIAAGAELWVARGPVNTVIYSSGNTCMVFASDMDADRLIEQIVRSGLVSP
jgi:anti-sigma factor RsiW